MTKHLEISFIQSIEQISVEAWGKVINCDYPFIQYDFIKALEVSGATSAKSGWLPYHLLIKDKQNLVGLMPLYIKNHSYGEYVFDFQWANAYHQSGLDYYPKLITAIPFTPATGQRIYLDESIDKLATYKKIQEKIETLCLEQNLSSWHVLFPTNQESIKLSDSNTFSRLGSQYHWFNRSYTNFEEFLANCKTKQRKNMRRERRGVEQQQLKIKMLSGEQITESLWQHFFAFYQSTYAKRSGNYGYLSESFFKLIGKQLPQSIVMGVATLNEATAEGAQQVEKIVAASLFFKDKNTLYGRYWGCSQEFDYLHFELCYYQGIDYCIKNQIQKFDAGAQGEHKIPRGFEPIETYSNHWVAHPEFDNAIRRFVEEEKRYVAQSITELEKKLPFKC
jgi:predicted N-acyltransferase